MIKQAARRRDNNVWRMLERITLCAERLSTTERQDLGIGHKARQATQFTRDLVCQLAGRAQYQRLSLEQRRVNMLQQTKTECGRFPTAGFRLHAYVAALKDSGQRGRLNRRHRDISQLVEVVELGGRQNIQGRKSGHSSLSW